MPEKETNGKEEAKQEQPEKEMKKGKEAKLEEALEKANADRDYWKNEYYKVFADTQNLRKSLEEDRRNAIKYRSAGFLEELLPALDGYYSALSIPPANDAVKNYLVGFQYIYNQITSILANEGVTEIEPKVGDRFDAMSMHAVDAVEDDGESNRIMKVYAKGYKLHDRMIRAAMVSVSKKREAPKAEEPAASETKAHKA